LAIKRACIRLIDNTYIRNRDLQLMDEQSSDNSLRMRAPKTIKDLVERFERNHSSYKNQGYNEAQLRQEFINPFFEALGWDIYNKSGAAPAYRDVIHEDSIKMAGGTKAPDYCFTLSGRRMFFVETKKPVVDVTKDPHPAYQLRRYAWSAGLSVSILTNFEELAIYESRQKPKASDKVNVERISLFSYKDYIEKWDEIARIFSKIAVLQGSFDKFVESAKQKRGTQQVGDEFLKEIEEWRKTLAKNIALRNPHLYVHELNVAVQSTIDRLIFLRMCEDRGIERYGQLQSLLENSKIYANLCKIYEKADEKYNSGLFHFKRERERTTPPDELTLQLKIEDKVLDDIIRHLYYPESPYEFSVLAPEILGNVYEQFLGKVIRLTEGHRAKVEEKPEVKKAGGVYYTPQYIVEYIVKNTVGQLCKNKTPKQIEKLRILDPACGSGSFLLGAYSYLLDYHLDYYTKSKNPKRFKDQIYQGKDSAWLLTIKEKKRILLSNLYGVDIDNQAVEVTKLSLLLKVLEGASRDIFEKQQKLWTERVLPDLGNNIKCGNSLIGSDFYNTGQTKFVNDNEEMYRINAFDWNNEFKEIIETGRFDIVIGNPPYVRQEELIKLKEYFQKSYQTYHSVADLYVFFIERGISLLKENGIFSYIVSNKWLRANYGRPLRQWLKNQNINEIIDFKDLPVFGNKVITYPCILRIQKNKQKSSKFSVTQIQTLDFKKLDDYVKQNRYDIKKSLLRDDGWSLSNIETQVFTEKLRRIGCSLNDYLQGKIFVGIKTALNEAFVIDKNVKENLIEKDKKSEYLIKPYLVGREIKRYSILKPEKYVIFIPKGWTKQNFIDSKDFWKDFSDEYPAIANHLLSYEEKARKRTDQGDFWWELRACDYYNEFEKTKIIYPEIATKGQFSIDYKNFYPDMTGFILGCDSKYLLGLLNSKLMTFIFSNISSEIRGGFLRWKLQYIKSLPIKTIDYSKSNEKKQHDNLVTLVDHMLDLHQRLSKTKTDNERIIIQRQIDATDQQIDQLVYELYGLTKKEIQIVEEATKHAK